MLNDRTLGNGVTVNAVLDKPDISSDSFAMDDVFSDSVWPKVRALAEAAGFKSDTVMKWRIRGRIPGDRRLSLAAATSDEAVRSALLMTSRGNSDTDTPNSCAAIGG